MIPRIRLFRFLLLIGLLPVAGALSAAETIDVPLANGRFQRLVVDETRVVVTSAAGATAQVGIAGLNAVNLNLAQGGGTVRLMAREAGMPDTGPANYLMGTTLMVKVKGGATIADIAARHGLAVDQAMNLPGYFVLSAADPLAAIRALRALQADAQVQSAEPNLTVPIAPQGLDSRALQWHLPIISVTGAWSFGVTGTGINITVVDTGIEASHPRLLNTATSLGANYITGGSPGPTWQFQPLPLDPTTGKPFADPEAHGTFVAGMAAATENGGSGIVGVAPTATLVSVKVFGIDEGTNNLALAQGLAHRITGAAGTRTDVSNNSWGPVLKASNPLQFMTQAQSDALVNGVTNGRGGLGIPYVFASGNGASFGGCDYAGITSNPYVIAVGALNESMVKANYSQAGVNVFTCAPAGDSAGSGKGSVSTDRVGKNGFVVLDAPDGDYSGPSDSLYGTSFACPQVAGLAALILSADATLTWRDVRAIIAKTAVASNIADADGWVTNAAGFHFNNKYGFGCINAANAVQNAKTWTKEPAESTPVTVSDSESPVLAIPDNSPTGATIQFLVNIPGDFTIESVEFTSNVTHTRRGDLSFTLRSPSGTLITVPGRDLDNGANDVDFTFCTVGFWHEATNGPWQLTVSDGKAANTGTLAGGVLTFHGYAGAVSGGGSGGSGGLPVAPGTAVPLPTGTPTAGPANLSHDSSGGSCGAGSSLGLLLVLSWLGGIAFIIRRR